MRRSYASPRRQPGHASQIVQYRLQQRTINGESGETQATPTPQSKQEPAAPQDAHQTGCRKAFNPNWECTCPKKKDK